MAALWFEADYELLSKMAASSYACADTAQRSMMGRGPHGCLRDLNPLRLRTFALSAFSFCRLVFGVYVPFLQGPHCSEAPRTGPPQRLGVHRPLGTPAAD